MLYCGAYQWSKLSPYPSRWKRFFISSLISSKQLFFVSGRISPQVLRCFHKPTTSLFVSLLFSNNSALTFLEGCFPSLFVVEVGIFFFILLFQQSSFYSFVPEALWCCSLYSSSWIEDRVLFVLIHLIGVSCHLFKFFSSYQVLHLFSTGVMSEFVLPRSLFISFQPEWFQCLLVHYARHS